MATRVAGGAPLASDQSRDAKRLNWRLLPQLRPTAALRPTPA